MGAPSDAATPRQREPAHSGPETAEGTSKRRWAAFATALIVVLGAGAGLQSSPGRDLLEAAGLTGRPTGYTELAFAEPETLPRLSSSTSLFAAPAFVIHNAIGNPHDYTWSLLLTASGRTIEAATGRAHLAAGQAVTITPITQVQCTPGPLTIGVRLDDGTESIRFQTTCTSDVDDSEGRSG